MYKFLIVSLCAFSALAAEIPSFSERYLEVEQEILCKNYFRVVSGANYNDFVECYGKPSVETVQAIERQIGTQRYNELLALEMVPGTPFMGLLEEVCTSEDVAEFQKIGQEIVRNPSSLDEIRNGNVIRNISRSCLTELARARGQEFGFDL